MFNYTKYDDDKADFQDVGAATLGNGERLYVETGGKIVLVFNVAGQFFAIDDICTHDGWSLEEGDLNEHIITCPRHSAKFDIRLGKVVEGPAPVDIPSYPVRVIKGRIQVGFPKAV